MRRLLLIIIVVTSVTGLLTRVAWVRWAPSPNIVISRETTYISSPLSDDGLPDYVEYLRRKYGARVTPENNAVAPIWRAVGPRDLAEKVRKKWFDQLGIESLPIDGEYYVPLDDPDFVGKGARWLTSVRESRDDSGEEPTEKTPAEQIDSLRDISPEMRAYLKSALDSGLTKEERLQRDAEEAFARLVDLASQRPWTAERFPPLSQWVQRNEKALDLAQEASKLSQYFSPFVSAGPPALLTRVLETGPQTRALARGLALRATWHVSAQRFHEAQQDIMAIHRLARLVGRPPNSMVDYLVALAIDAVGCEAHMALVSDASAPNDILQTSLVELRELNRWQSAASVVDEGERLMALDAILNIRRDVSAATRLGQHGNALSDHVRSGVFDWNIVLRELNSTYNEVVEAMRLSDRAERGAAADSIADGIDAKTYGYTWKLRAAFSRTMRSQLIAEIFKSLLLPATNSFAQAQERVNMRLDLTMTAAALAVYRAQHGSYPAELSDLAPEIIDEVPHDLYVGGPLRYERRSDGYLLYSVFSDGEDNGGTNLDGTIVDGEWTDEPAERLQSESDMVIRVSIPALTAMP